MTPAATTAGGSGSGSGGGPSSETPDTAAAGAPEQDMVRKGERGSSCSSNNDCADDLSCIVTHDCPAGVNCANKSCQPSNFGLMGTGKRCYVHECATKKDCCGKLPQTRPAKCDDKTNICATPYLTGCTTRACTASQDCGAGTCPAGICSIGATSCTSPTDCAANTCDPNTKKCTLTQTDCTTLACTTNYCSTRYCNCQNPDYQPANPICTDPDCDNICGFTCQDERCVVDKHCESDKECAAVTPYCAEGACVECRTKDDCKNEECVDGHCGPECESDTQCKLFESCQKNHCVFVGCRTDRECVLQAGSSGSTQDPRLAKCQIKDDVGTCVFPCEIDAQCASTEICLDGICSYLGCETDSECKTIAGLQNLPPPTPERPWVTTVECRAENTAKP
jgi:hypothetical protein